MAVIYEPKGKAREYSPLALNIYNGCTHGCFYCYSPSCLRKTKVDFHQGAVVRKDIERETEKDLIGMRSKMDDRRVLLCFTCDPYPADTDDKVTRRVLQLFQRYGRPFQVLTKGGKRAIRDFDLYSKQDAFACTLTFYDPDLSRSSEPRAALPMDRIEALRTAKKRGIETWVSFEPVIDEKEVYRLFDATYEFIDQYKIGKLNYSRNEVNYSRFLETMINKLNKANKRYYIKKDLEEFM